MARNREKLGSLIYQVEQDLQGKLAIGESRHIAKADGSFRNKIYSWNTYKAYKRQARYFCQYVKATYPEVRKIADARQYVDEYLLHRGSLSAYTQKLDAAALAKLYNCRSVDFQATAARQRAAITRSRGEKKRDKHFSEEKNAEFVEFCKSVGLRRAELANLRPEQLLQLPDGSWALKIKGKGGRLREAPILGNEALEKIKNTESGHKVWPKLPVAADIHAYRAEYATRIYLRYARNEIPKEDRYFCRRDLKGICLDKKAMLVASKALGHNRISVIAGHYIRPEELQS